MEPKAYYNEIDPYAAQWLRNLIAAGHIASGDVDERSIEDVNPDDLRGYTQCHFFAGIGVWSHALRLAGWPDSRPVWTGSCPCQPFSAAGKSGGFDDERHLWPAFHHLISQRRPPVVFGEQVASKDGLAWLDLVQTDLEGADYAAAAVDLCAAGVGAPHIRQRLFWVADTSSGGRQPEPVVRSARLRGSQNVAEKQIQQFGADGSGPCGMGHSNSGHASPTNGQWRDVDWLLCRDERWRPVEPSTFPLAYGATARVGRLRAYGNAIVPQVAAEVIEAYMRTHAEAVMAEMT